MGAGRGFERGGGGGGARTEVEGGEAGGPGHGPVEVLGGGGAREVVGAGGSLHRHHASAGGAGRHVAAGDGRLEPVTNGELIRHETHGTSVPVRVYGADTRDAGWEYSGRGDGGAGMGGIRQKNKKKSIRSPLQERPSFCSPMLDFFFSPPSNPGFLSRIPIPLPLFPCDANIDCTRITTPRTRRWRIER